MTQILQNDYNTDSFFHPDVNVNFQTSLDLPVTLKLSEEIKETDISFTVIKAVEDSGIVRFVTSKGRTYHGYSSLDMLKAVILSHTLSGSVSLRDMEENVRNDIRFRLIFKEGHTPSFMSFQRFLNENLKENVDVILAELNKYFLKEAGEFIDTDYETIDGTKEEADANKMSFVWRRASEKYYVKTYRKLDDLIKELIAYFNERNIVHHLSILRKYDLAYMMEIADFIRQYVNDNKVVFVYGKGSKKSLIQKMYESIRDLAISIWKYEIHFDILEDRNSFSKSDPDATFMHMKYDYYNHTNVFKPGYNVQFGNCSGCIWDIYISDDCNDLYTYIPLMEKHYTNYGSYPLKTPADAGYGSYDNYKFCKDHGIELYMKYSGYEKKREKISDKNRFKAIHFLKDENGFPVCPAGYSFRLEKERIEKRGIYERKMETLVNDHCEGCPLKSKCTKSKSNQRRINRCTELDEWQKEVDENLSSLEGRRLMEERAIYSEGFFGDKKSNWKYDRLRRIGESGVKMEIYLYAYGKNMRRFHEVYWKKKTLERESLSNLIEFARKHKPSKQ